MASESDRDAEQLIENFRTYSMFLFKEGSGLGKTAAEAFKDYRKAKPELDKDGDNSAFLTTTLDHAAELAAKLVVSSYLIIRALNVLLRDHGCAADKLKATIFDSVFDGSPEALEAAHMGLMREFRGDDEEEKDKPKEGKSNVPFNPEKAPEVPDSLPDTL